MSRKRRLGINPIPQYSVKQGKKSEKDTFDESVEKFEEHYQDLHVSELEQELDYLRLEDFSPENKAKIRAVKNLMNEKSCEVEDDFIDYVFGF